MGKMLISTQGCTVAIRNNERSYTLNFSSENEAASFESELKATLEDVAANGRDNAVRKKALFSSSADCTIQMNFDKANSQVKWPFKATMSSVEDLQEFYDELRTAIWGRMPSI